MRGFDAYERWRSCVFEVSGFVAPSWEALEEYERRAWEKFSERTNERRGDPNSPIWDQPQTQ